MAYQQKIWKDKRSQWEIFQDRMYQRYIDEKELYKETDILSKENYLKKNKDFLIRKLKEKPHDR
jgi:hypothetical protein|tara:strand:- start:110 stop:301 length:192 start_codon:yes stop_codon:yes gene_type:complete